MAVAFNLPVHTGLPGSIAGVVNQVIDIDAVFAPMKSKALGDSGTILRKSKVYRQRVLPLGQFIMRRIRGKCGATFGAIGTVLTHQPTLYAVSLVGVAVDKHKWLIGGIDMRIVARQSYPGNITPEGINADLERVGNYGD